MPAPPGDVQRWLNSRWLAAHPNRFARSARELERRAGKPRLKAQAAPWLRVSADDILRNLHPNRSIAHDYSHASLHLGCKLCTRWRAPNRFPGKTVIAERFSIHSAGYHSSTSLVLVAAPTARGLAPACKHATTSRQDAFFLNQENRRNYNLGTCRCMHRLYGRENTN